MKKKLLILSLIGFLATTVKASSIEVSGDVSGLWSADTVFVMSDLSIAYGQSLEISPGTRVIFWGHFRIEVQGKITAMGQAGDSIIFTVRDTANFHNQTTERGGWFGIRFTQTPNTNDTSAFSYCRFEYGKAFGDSVQQNGGAIFAQDFSKLRISNCLFYHNYSFVSGGAVYLWNSDAIITNNSFIDNYAGNTGTVYGYGGGICVMHASPHIRNNYFSSNLSTGVGGGLSMDDADPVFYDNIFDGNYSALGGGLGVLRSSPSTTFSNLLIVNNEGLYFGGGLCCIRSFPVFSNLTIADNACSYGGGFYCNDSAVPSMYNSIIYNNYGLGISVYIWDVRSAPNFYYCDIEGGAEAFEGSGGHEGYHGVYQNNIDNPPAFYGLGNFPYQLTGGSPCIDEGTPEATFLNLPGKDLSGALRIWNNRIDMGTYEFNGTTEILKPEKEGLEITVIPNPFVNKLEISFREVTTENLHFIILNQGGKAITCFDVPAGTKQYLFQNQEDPAALKAGAYFLKCTGSKQNIVQKIIKL